MGEGEAMGKGRKNFRGRSGHSYPKVEFMPSILVGLLFTVASLSASIALPAGSAAATTNTWIAVASPNEGTQENELDGLSCVSTTSCVAVGLYDYGTGTLIESWNGNAWSIVSSPNEGYRPSLSSVSCVTSADCVAVGGYSPTGNKGSTLVESFNGASWSIVPSPNRPGKNGLLSVSCTKKNFCMAVGSSGNTEPDPAAASLVEIWNGTVCWASSGHRNPKQCFLRHSQGVHCGRRAQVGELEWDLVDGEEDAAWLECHPPWCHLHERIQLCRRRPAD